MVRHAQCDLRSKLVPCGGRLASLSQGEEGRALFVEWRPPLPLTSLQWEPLTPLLRHTLHLFPGGPLSKPAGGGLATQQRASTEPLLDLPSKFLRVLSPSGVQKAAWTVGWSHTHLLPR